MRFASFDEPLILCSLQELFNISAAGDIEKGKVSNIKTDIFCYPIIGNALTNSGLYGYTDSWKQNNSITVTGRGEIGIAFERPYKYYPIVRLLTLKPKGKSDLKYFECLINSRRILNESTGVPQLTTPQIGKQKYYIVAYEEQRVIGDLFRKIDERIETQNKIIEKYESLKIGIKESIYLLSKEKEPLEKILHEVSEKSTTQNQYPVLSSTVKGLFLQNEYFDRSIASDNNIGYKIVHKGQIIISPQNLWMGNLTFNDKYENGIVSPSYKIYDIDQKYSKKYIYWLLTSKRSFFNYGLVSEQGASIVRRNLSIDAFMGLSIPVVKDRNCESKIEKLIDLIEKKLETEKKRESLLNQQKQFLLSNLFI